MLVMLQCPNVDSACVQDMKNVVSSLSLDDIERIATENIAKTS